MKRNVATYSQFVNEARTKEWLDDVDDKFGKINRIRIDDTTKIRVLEYIYESGENGRSYTDIVKFIVEEIKGMTYDWKKHRGYWATNLTASVGFWGGKNSGLLTQYCEKNENGRWVLANAKLKSYFMKSDFRGVLDDDAMSALKDLLY